MKQRLDKFMAINTFVAIVDTGSFTAATKRLGISASTATKIMARLEKEMGVRLIHRNTRQIALTAQGRDFYNHCIRILAELEEAENLVYTSTTSPVGTLRVVTAPSFGRLTLVPALPAFFKRYPNIKIELDASNAPIDVIGEGYDCWITGRSDVLASLGLTMHLLGRSPLKIFGSKQYFAEHGTPRTPQDLANHNCIVVAGLGTRWHFKLEDDAPYIVTPEGSLKFRSGDAVRDAVRAGVGIAQAPSWLFRDDIRTGTVRSVLDKYVTGDRPLSVIFPKYARVPNTMRVFIDYLADITRTLGTTPRPTGR